MSHHEPLTAAGAVNPVCKPESALSELRAKMFPSFGEGDALWALEELELRLLENWHAVTAAKRVIEAPDDATLESVTQMHCLLNAALVVLAATVEPMAAVRAGIAAGRAAGSAR